MNKTKKSEVHFFMNTMELKVSDKRKKKGLVSGMLESVKYIAIIVVFAILALAAAFAVSAVVSGDMFNVFKYNLEQPVMAVGALIAMLIIKKEGKVVFPKSKKLSVAFYLGMFLAGFASISAFSYILLTIENVEVHFNLSKQLAAVFIAPICEEFLTRYLLTAVIRKNGEKVHVIALLVTAFVFTMMHTPVSIISFSRFMIVALFIGLVYQITGSFKACVINHFASNLGATCLYLLANHFSVPVKATLGAAFTVVTILGVVLVIKEMKKAN